MKIRQFVNLLAILLLIVCIAQPVVAETDDPATNYYNGAEVALSMNEYEKALEYFNKALASNTTLIGMGDALMFTYRDKSGVLTALGRYDEAIQTANQGLLQFRNDTGLWNNKGYALFKQGKYNDAIDAFNTALRIDPSYLKGWINKGNALYEAGRYQDAADAYNKALELNPGNDDATAGLLQTQKAAGTAGMTMTIVWAVILIVAAGGVIWYVKYRKPADQKPSGKSKKEKKE